MISGDSDWHAPNLAETDRWCSQHFSHPLPGFQAGYIHPWNQWTKESRPIMSILPCAGNEPIKATYNSTAHIYTLSTCSLFLCWATWNNLLQSQLITTHLWGMLWSSTLAWRGISRNTARESWEHLATCRQRPHHLGHLGLEDVGLGFVGSNSVGCSPERFGCKAFGPSMATPFPWATRQMCEAVLPPSCCHCIWGVMPPAQLKPFRRHLGNNTHHTETFETEELELVISKPLRFYNLYCLHQFLGFLGGAASGELATDHHWSLRRKAFEGRTVQQLQAASLAPLVGSGPRVTDDFRMGNFTSNRSNRTTKSR